MMNPAQLAFLLSLLSLFKERKVFWDMSKKIKPSLHPLLRLLFLSHVPSISNSSSDLFLSY
jgi:hypothetical protein